MIRLGVPDAERDRRIAEAAHAKIPQAEIGAELGLTQRQVSAIALRLGVAPGRGRNCKTSFIGPTGYFLTHRPEHPRANRFGYVPAHIVVAEEKLGRPITRNEHVHHINEVRTDNRPENLEVLSPSEHQARHASRRRRPMPDEDMLAMLRGLAERLGHTPASRDISAVPSMPGPQTYMRRFGSLPEAQKRAGLPPNSRGRPVRRMAA